MECLFLHDNKLTSLPESLLNMEKLTTLWVKDNPLMDDKDPKTEEILKKLEKKGVEVNVEYYTNPWWD